MTDVHGSNGTPPTPRLDDPAELQRFLAAYRPTGLASGVWSKVADPAATLVMQAGEPTRLRVEKDIQLLGAVVAHLVERGRPVTLDEALSDTTLISFDTALNASPKTRENKRGITRRLQAVHRGLPWRTERRADGTRVHRMVAPTEVANLLWVVDAAQSSGSQDAGAEAFLAAVSAARAIRRAETGVVEVDDATWGRARTFANRQGWHMTRVVLRAVVTHEVLNRNEPAAVLITHHALTRRDLDLALTCVNGLPEVPSESHHELLRGSR